MDSSAIYRFVQQQHEYFRTGQTKDISFRVQQLKALREMVTRNEAAILQALKADLNKPHLEAYSAEVGILRLEIDFMLKHIKAWSRPRRVPIHVTQFPASAWIYQEPYGVALIIAAWNYPFQLLIAPLAGAIAAGNCAILKPSEIAPNTSALVARLIGETFDPRYVTVVEGGADVAQALLAERFDSILYTGSSTVGRLVMQAAARYLTPVTLEMGGKSPCIVDGEVDVEQAARRIIWGKFFNAGQVCIAPDYVLVDRRIKPALIEAMRKCISAAYPGDAQLSPDYCRIIDQRHFERLCRLLPATPQDGTVVIGGQTDAAHLYIAPTVIDAVPPDGPLMQEEIFGPLLPIIAYDQLNEAIAFVNARPKPLALYLFSTNKANQERVLRATSSGGGCINDTLMQYSNPLLPFGGVGMSGMGRYHGRASFDTFSHEKSFVKKDFLFDIWIRYAPYKDKHKLLKWFL